MYPPQRDAMMAAIVEASNDAIISFTCDGKVLSWNRGAEAMFGYADVEIVGQPLLLLSAPDLEAEHYGIVQAVLQGEQIAQFETVRVRKNGEQFPVSESISPIRDEDRMIVGAAVIMQDITPRDWRPDEVELLQEISDRIFRASNAPAPSSRSANPRLNIARFSPRSTKDTA